MIRNKLCSKALRGCAVFLFVQLFVLQFSSTAMAQGVKGPEKDTLAPWQVMMKEKNLLFSPFLKRMLILDGKVMPNAAYTLDTITKTSIRTMSVITIVPADSILKYGDAAKEGIIIVERN